MCVEHPTVVQWPQTGCWWWLSKSLSLLFAFFQPNSYAMCNFCHFFFFFRFLVANFVKNFILLMSWDYKIEFLCFSLTSNKKTKKKKEEKCPLQKQFKYGYYIERPLASSSRKSKKRKKVELEFASQILFSHKFFHSLNKILFEIHFRRYIWFRLLLLLLSSRPSTIKQQTKKKERTFT